MRLLAVALDHQSAPLDIRQQLAIPPQQAAAFLTAIVPAFAGEAVLLSTCNRIEVYLAEPPVSPDGVLAALRRFCGHTGSLPVNAVISVADRDAIARLFSIAAGLRSQVLGDQAISGQVRDALEAAGGAAGPILTSLFQRAIAAGRRARRAAGFDHGARSAGDSAAELLLQTLGTLRGKTAMVLGSGSSGASAAQGLRQRGISRLLLVNRNRHRAESLAARVGGLAMGLDELEQALAMADCAICSTSAPYPLIRPGHLTGRPLTLVDIAVPADVDSAVRQVANVHLFDLDDLDSLQAPPAEEQLARAWDVVAAETEAFERWHAGRRTGRTLQRLREHANAIGQAELDHALRRLDGLDEHEREVIAEMAHRLVQKLVHPPIVWLRASAEGGTPPERLAELFAEARNAR